jgi:hypothetical protein
MLINDITNAKVGDVVRLPDGQMGICITDDPQRIVWRKPMEDDDTWIHRTAIRRQILADIASGHNDGTLAPGSTDGS